MALGKQAILKHAGRYKTREVHMPEWADGDDDVVLVRSITLREWELHQSQDARKGAGKLSAGLLARVILDDNGGRVFSDDDADQLAELVVGDANELTDAVLEISGLTDESADEIRGNSEAAQSGSSSSDSAPTSTTATPTSSNSD